MRTRTRTIVPGTIIPIRRKLCYCTSRVEAARHLSMQRDRANRAGGADPNEAKVSPLDQRELESFAL